MASLVEIRYLLYSYHLPLEKSPVFHLSKLETPLNQLRLVPRLNKLGNWFWRKRFGRVVNTIFIFFICSDFVETGHVSVEETFLVVK